MTWIEHSLVGAGIYSASKGLDKKLSLSALLIGSTVLMDMDHLWFRIATKTVFMEDDSLSMSFWLNSGTWTHSLVYLFTVSALASSLFRNNNKVFISFMLGGFFHLVGDWLYRQWLFDMGIMWFWPFFWGKF